MEICMYAKHGGGGVDGIMYNEERPILSPSRPIHILPTLSFHCNDLCVYRLLFSGPFFFQSNPRIPGLPGSRAFMH